jgi:hypothetical protein
MPQPGGDSIPSTLARAGAGPFWLTVLLTGIGTGAGAAVLTRLLEIVQRFMWNGGGTNLLEAAKHSSAWRHILVLLGAGLVTGAGQIILRQLSSGNGIDTTAAIWFHAGRMPAWRTLGSALLSVVIVGMGVSLGREGAPKQAGAVIANFFSDRARLSDEQRRLLVACGAGAGMGAAYGVPLGGALFALEVMRGMLALRYVLPALFASVVATAVSWVALPDAPTYPIPSYSSSISIVAWALLAGPLAGMASVGYVRLVTWAERNKPDGWRRLTAPLLALRTTWRGIHPVAAVAGQRQGHFATCVHQPGSAGFASDAGCVETRRHRAVGGLWRPWRLVHAFSDGGRVARGGTGACLVVVLAGRVSWAVRRAWCGSGARGHYTGADLDCGTDDGTDRAGQILYRAAIAGCGNRYSGGADHRASLYLRRPSNR